MVRQVTPVFWSEGPPFHGGVIHWVLTCVGCRGEGMGSKADLRVTPSDSARVGGGVEGGPGHRLKPGGGRRVAILSRWPRAVGRLDHWLLGADVQTPTGG